MAVIKLRDAIGSRMAYEFLKRRISLTKIAPKSKRPVEKDWQNKFYSSVEDASQFTEHNLGFILGSASGWLTDIDLDCDEAVKLAPHILPGTRWVFGRKSNQRSHYLYLATESKTTKFASPLKDGGMLLEIRSDGAQTVAPGSIHPSGEAISFYDKEWKNNPPRQVASAELDQRCRDLAAAVLLLRHGWTPGKRDEIAVSVCGLMLRMSREHEYIDQFLGGIATAAGDEELDMRLKADYQAERLKAGDKVPGIPHLLNLLGSDIGSRVIDWLGVKNLNVVHEMNQEIAVVSLGDKTRILIDGGYWSDSTPRFMKSADAKILYQSRGTIFPPGEKKSMPKFDYWLTSNERRSYSKIVFKPSGSKDHEYNLWKGWPTNTQHNPDGCKLFLHHVKEVICSNDPDLYDYVITWLADAIQNPDLKPGIALVLQGAQGTGKTMFGEYIMALYGKYGLISTNSDHLFGRFNFHLANKLMCFADESCWAGNRHHASILNNLITANTLGFESKGVDQINVENHLRIIMATNDEWSVPASGIARRFCVLEVSGDRQGDRDYFRELKFEMDNDGPECLMGFLKDFKIRRELKNVPRTDAILSNKLLTIANNQPILAWWIKRLFEGRPHKGLHGWKTELEVDCVYRDYVNSVAGASLTSKSEQTSFGILWKKIVPSLYIIKKQAGGERKRYYVISTLEMCRKYVAEKILNEPKLFERTDL